MKKPTKKDWAKWLAYKSNKDLWIEQQEREEELRQEREELKDKLSK